jgi:hypothetical protein
MHMKKTLVAIGAGIGVVGIGTAGVLTTRHLQRRRLGEPITAAITINAEPHEVYARWREFDFLRDAEISVDVPGRGLAWRAKAMRGHVTFQPAPGGRGTELRLELQSTGTLPELHRDLRRFKQIVETGEIMVSDASSVPFDEPAPEGGVR